MEKHKSHYSLDEIKKAFPNVTSLRISNSALVTMIALNLTRYEVVKIIQELSSKDFYKSMTSFIDHRVWQDVYHAKYQNLVIYLKITIDDEGYFVISFKEK